MDYGIRELPNSRNNLLHSLILSRDPPTANEVQRLYETLIKDEGPIKALLERSSENHHFRAALVTNPDEMLPKLSQFLRSIKFIVPHRNTQYAGTTGFATEAIRIPDAFTRHVALVLIDEAPGTFDISSSGYHDFIFSVLEMYIPLAQFATASLNTLRDLISRILEMPREVCTIEKIVSEVTGATLLRDLLENNSLIHRVFTDVSLRLFGDRLAKLITGCIASHGSDIEDLVLGFESLGAIQKKIEEQALEIESKGQFTVIGRIPIRLGEAEKEFLNLARIAIPYNITTAKHTIESLLGRCRDQIRMMLSSFPCSTCKARLFGVIKTRPDYTPRAERRRDFDDINAPLGVFPIYLSDTAMRDLKSSRVDGNFSKILRTLQKLADGMWESDTELSVSSSKSRARSESALRAARWCPEGYILWERGIGRVEESCEEWIQIVKIIRVGSQTDVKTAISAARKAQRTYSKEYRRAAAISIRNPARPGTLMPKKFIGKDAIGLEVNNAIIFGSSSSSRKLSPSDALILHKIFCTGKQYSLTKRVAEMILQGGHQAEVPFVVSPEEEFIVNYFDSSLCILGRSGTGKTTCLVFRLLASYIRDRLTNNDKEVRQIFLTRSPVLAEKIRQYVSRLINSHCMKFGIVDYVAEDSDTDAITDEDEITTTSLLDVDDKSWPMICTFDSFATMLGRSLRFAQRNVFSSDSETSNIDTSNRRVDFGKFKRSYWPSFPTSAKKGLSVDGVFSEISGVIKASSSASAYQPLSEQQYQDLSYRVAPNFRPGPEREAVYGLYKAYEKRKTFFREWDDLDRIFELHRLLARDEKLSSRLRSQVTEVFVDEVQDQRLPEIELLLDLVNDIKSFAFAGDTAQCISRDSCFRFQDLKNLFFQKYESLGALARQKNLAKLNLFTLSKNYRTHNGILKLAAKIVDVLSTTFPYAIDKFSPELGDFDGPSPTVFNGFSSEDFINFILRDGEEGGAAVISEFGAEQVLIVRDEEAKYLLSKAMGDKVMILTILESKGMEFQDVFLFDFFSGSSCQSAFRALAKSQTTGSRLDDTKHPELCIELKNLYVAITRSRERLYILESSVSAVQPMHDMWGLGTENAIIDIVSLDDPIRQTRLGEIKLEQSNPEEWTQKGNEFFNQRMYEQATYCYRRAGKSKLVDVCQAFIIERSGRDIISDPNSWELARQYYLEAAKLFRRCEWDNRALKCYESIKEYLMAAELCEELSKISEKASENYALRAAGFFMDAGEIPRAIPLYKQLGRHERAISAYRKDNNVKELISYLKQYQSDIEEKLYNQNARIIALTILSSKDTSNDLKKPAISLLSEQEQENLYNQFKFYKELQKLLISQGRLEDAIKLSYSEGYWGDLRDLLKQVESNPNFDRELLTARGEQFAERILFYELSTSLVALIRRGSTEAFEKGVTFQKFSSYPRVSELFHDTAKSLNERIFNETDCRLKKSYNIPPESLLLADLLILQLFDSEEEKIASWIQSAQGLMNDVLMRSTQRLLDLYRTRILTNVDILKLFFQVIQSEDSGGYNVVKPSPIHNGNSDGGQQITSDEFLERIIGLLRQWVVKAFSCYANNCRFGQHRREIQSDEMMNLLQMAWSMSLLTSYCSFVDRNGAFGGRWCCEPASAKRVWDPSAGLFLAKKRSTAFSLRQNANSSFRGEDSIILGCLDNFAWRLRGLMRNMAEPDFWKMLDAWERMAALRSPRGVAKRLWWDYIRDIEPWGQSAMRTLHEVEFCLSNPSQIQYALRSFNQKFRASLLQLSRSNGLANQPQGSNEIHNLLNRIDRVMAIAVYLSSHDDLVLKKSQIEFLRNNGALRLGRGKEHNEAAAEVLNTMVDIYDLISQTMVQSVRDAWYRHAMYRRIEKSTVLAILNSKIPYDYPMIGRKQFIEDFFQRARGYTFWIVRQGAPNPQAAHGVPDCIEKFPAWMIANIGLVQSQADPILFAHLYEKPRYENKFRGFPVTLVPFSPTFAPELPSQSEEINRDQTADASDNIENEESNKSLANEESSISVKAAVTIQRNWRICSNFIRNKRYLDQHPIHRRITRILKSLDLPLESNHGMFRKCFRLVGFVLLELIQEIKFELGAITARLGDVGRKMGSMEVMERILNGDEMVRDYNDKIRAIEKSIEPSSLASIVGTKSIVAEILVIIRETQGLQERVSSSTSDLDSWIQSCV
ncbi:hypothetical protein TWF132_011064 [Orbilia oligospora]|nr:hypothetical protein TWF128_011253 [Orbilia oligospora]KAF3281842.1 hypothetical protein TWF132_011064 [Orbilia oligospora]